MKRNMSHYRGKHFMYLAQSFLGTFILFLTLQSYSQSPTITVRFANPQFDCVTNIYCVDVEFQSTVPNQRLFGQNVRFFIDHQYLEFLSFGDYAAGYGPVAPNPPDIYTGNLASGPANFGFDGASTFVNGAIQLTNPGAPTINISTSGWTKVYNMCFLVKDPSVIGIDSFCPSIVLDLQEDPSNGGFEVGSQGVVITLANPGDPSTSLPAIENVVQYNWSYSSAPGLPFGQPVETICIATECEAVAVPLSNWALYLGILLISLFIMIRYRRIVA